MGERYRIGSETRRVDYLQRMGIDVYRRRDRESAGLCGNPLLSPVSDAGDDSGGCGWEALEALVRDCTRCPLHQTRNRSVFGVGDRQARLMIVGEAPGGEEDQRGEPFVGRAGRLLDQMLLAIGLSREVVYITNLLKSRPPRNRDPRPDEVAACEPYLHRQIELVSPELILAVGRLAAQHLLRSDRPLARLRENWHRYGPEATPLLATYHPAYLLRNPADKRKAWEDLKRVRERLRTGTGGRP